MGGVTLISQLQRSRHRLQLRGIARDRGLSSFSNLASWQICSGCFDLSSNFFDNRNFDSIHLPRSPIEIQTIDPGCDDKKFNRPPPSVLRSPSVQGTSENTSPYQNE
jgi:hypothetical protein